MNIHNTIVYILPLTLHNVETILSALALVRNILSTVSPMLCSFNPNVLRVYSAAVPRPRPIPKVPKLTILCNLVEGTFLSLAVGDSCNRN